MPEQHINALGLSFSDDYDYDYDVFYFAPSRSPYIVSPEDFEALDQLEVRTEGICSAEETLTMRYSQGPGLHRWTLLNDNFPTRSISPVSHSFPFIRTS